MGKIKTSSIFYRRGVSNQHRNFGFAMQTNYPIIQPMNLFINSVNRINQTSNQPPQPPQPSGPQPPSPPINVIATLGAQSLTANISWTIPVSDGGSPITSYTIISNPDSITITTSNTNTIITGLTKFRNTNISTTCFCLV